MFRFSDGHTGKDSHAKRRQFSRTPFCFQSGRSERRIIAGFLEETGLGKVVMGSLIVIAMNLVEIGIDSEFGKNRTLKNERSSIAAVSRVVVVTCSGVPDVLETRQSR